MDEHGIPGAHGDELEDELSTERLTEVARGLVRGKAVCLAAVRKVISVGESEADQLSPRLSRAYDAVLDRVEDFARRAQGLTTKQDLLEFRKALKLLSPGEDLFALAEKGDMALAGLGTFEALLAQSWAVRYDNPKLMCQLARGALKIALSFEPEIHGAQQVADYQARAWAELGNSYRVANRYQEAASALKTARDLQKEGTGDPALLARILELQASFLGTRREWKTALPSLRILPRLYRKLGQSHLTGRALMIQALYTYYSGQPEKAIRINNEGLALIDLDREPELAVVAMKNHLLYLTDCGQFEVAWRMLFEHRTRFQSLGRVATLKLRGTEGRINYGLKKLTSAEIIFREVKRGFAEHNLVFASALATLDLAIVLMAQHRIDEAEKEVLEAVPIFLSLDIQPEIYGCLILLEEAFRMREADLELLEGTVRFIRKKQIEYGIPL